MRTAMSNETKETGSSFMEKLSTVIVDKRNLIFLLTIILLVFSAFSRNWVEVESDLTYYLPSDSETKQALDIMDEQFTTYGTAEVMVANITPEQAAALEPKIKEIKGVQSVDYDETTAHYNNLSALYSITFAYSEDDEACLDSLEAVKEYLSDYDLYVDTDLGNTQQETIDHEISVIMVYVAIVIVHRAALHVRDLRRGAGAHSDVRGRACAESGHELPDGQDLVHFKLGHKHLAVGAVHRLRHHLLQPI